MILPRHFRGGARRKAGALFVLGAVAACNAPPPPQAPAPPARVEAPPVLTTQQLRERTERCASRTRAGFRREWKDGVVSTPEGQLNADFAYHYNAKLDTCFYLLHVSRQAIEREQGGELPVAITRKLIDVNEGEVYGEFAGPGAVGSLPQGFPDTCKVTGLYCASEREWDVLVRFFMEN